MSIEIKNINKSFDGRGKNLSVLEENFQEVDLFLLFKDNDKICSKIFFFMISYCMAFFD